MSASQWGELAGAVVTVLLALAGFLNSRTAKTQARQALSATRHPSSQAQQEQAP